MSRIYQKDIDYILDNIDIVELVREYVNLERRGKNFIGNCPFHSENTPSFTVSPEKRIAHCFGCHTGGNIFQFLSKIENITYNQAVVKLGNRLGMNLYIPEEKKYNFDLNDDNDILYYANQLISNYYNYILLNTKEADKALQYLLDRGITRETIKHFNIGYAPDKEVAIDFFKSQNISLESAERAGIIGKNTDSGQYYDVFKNRIMFPIKDDLDRVVAFSGRTLINDKKIAKYYNTHETEIFEKGNVLYNLSNARQHIQKENQILLCEGYMDVVRAHQYGVKNIVAIMGTSLSDKNLAKITNLTKNILLSLDNDSAGVKATLDIGDQLLTRNTNLYTLAYTSAKDIDEFISNMVAKDGDFDFKNYISNNRNHYVEYKINILSEKTKSDIESKIIAKNKILNQIATVIDNSLKDILLTNLSSKFGINKNILVKELYDIEKKIPRKNNIIQNNARISTIFNDVNYDRKLCILFKYFFSDRNLFLEHYSELENLIFSKEVFNTLLDNLVLYYNNYNTFEIYKFLTYGFDSDLVKLVTYIENSNFLIISNDKNNDIIKDYINYFKKNSTNYNEVIDLKESLKSAILEESYEKQLLILEKLKKHKK